MKIIFSAATLLLAVSCTPSVPLAPQLGALRVVSAGATSLTIPGRDLDVESVVVAGNAATITSSATDGVTVQLMQPLAAGEYSVTITNRGGLSATREAALSVLEPAGTDGIAPGTAPGEAFVSFRPAANRADVLGAVNQAGFDVLGAVNEPFVTSGLGICAQVTMSVLDRSKPPRATVTGLNALIEELNKGKPGDNPNAKAVMTANPPAFDGAVEPTGSTRGTVRPLGLPEDLAGLRVAVLDTGVNPHMVFGVSGGTMLDLGTARNFTLEDNPSNTVPVSNDVSDLAVIDGATVGHGTAVAGLIASTLRAQLGTDLPSAAGLIVPVKVCERTATGNLCRSSSETLGVCYALSLAGSSRPVRVINLSANATQPASYLLSALRAAAAAGISIVTPAGNRGLETVQPANYPAFYSVNLPGQHDAVSGMIAVGSLKPATVNAPAAPSGFSSVGAWVTLSAQGEGLDLASSDGLNFYQKAGTSFSAPQVAAAALMLRAQNPALGIDAVKVKLSSSATPVPGCAVTKCGAGALNVKGALGP